MLSKLNLNAGYWDIFWPQLLQGISMGMLFVPLTTVTNAPIPKEQMGNATSLYNLMRNIGASIGIASVTTIVARHSQAHANDLARHVTAYDPAAVALLNTLKNGMIASGADPATATQKAYALAFAMVQQHAAMLAYLDAFFLLAVMFIAVIPLIFIMRKPTLGGGGPESMGH
jgi:MFS transporter, DHA2 family, multidrug resistance protein